LIRILSILLISTYFLGSLGLKVNQHFCGGRLVKLELLFGQQPKDCSGKVPLKKKKCCSDKVQNLKVDQGKQTLEKMLGEPVSFTPLLISGFFLYVVDVNSNFGDVAVHHANGPPNSPNSVPLFLLHRSILV